MWRELNYFIYLWGEIETQMIHNSTDCFSESVKGKPECVKSLPESIRVRMHGFFRRIFGHSMTLRSLRVLWRQYFGFRRSRLGYCGRDVDLIPPIEISNPGNMLLLGHNGLQSARILNARARFVMMEHSGAGPGLTVVTGDHELRTGRFYRSITEEEKCCGLDRDVIVESDVWIGCNVTLLKGVRVGRGGVIAAGAVVDRDTLPYALSAGVPARFVKFVRSHEEILFHESVLYPEEKRMSNEDIDRLFSMAADYTGR